MNVRRLTVLAWFGALGGAAAWATQFVVGMQLGLARCEGQADRFRIPIEGWSIGLAAGASLIVIGAQLAAFMVFRATREPGESVPAQRLHFLATVALTVNPLVLAAAVMAGVGVPVLAPCHQS
jgi:hypothetical protein